MKGNAEGTSFFNIEENLSQLNGETSISSAISSGQAAEGAREHEGLYITLNRGWLLSFPRDSCFQINLEHILIYYWEKIWPQIGEKFLTLGIEYYKYIHIRYIYYNRTVEMYSESSD